jgi:hypothetical protein
MCSFLALKLLIDGFGRKCINQKSYQLVKVFRVGGQGNGDEHPIWSGSTLNANTEEKLENMKLRPRT